MYQCSCPRIVPLFANTERPFTSFAGGRAWHGKCSMLHPLNQGLFASLLPNVGSKGPEPGTGDTTAASTPVSGCAGAVEYKPATFPVSWVLGFFNFVLTFFLFVSTSLSHTPPPNNEACLIQCYAMDLYKDSLLVSATQFFLMQYIHL